MRRVNGCQCPWRPGQAIGLAVWLLVVAGCYALFIPVIPHTSAQVAVTVLFTVAALAVTGTFIVVCSIDPATSVSDTPAADRPLYCDHCEGYVLRGSKHCKECHKCVENFDHHCKWVNNCIGSKNYRPFFILLVSFCSMLAVQLGCGIYLIIRCLLDPSSQAGKLEAVYPSSIDVRAYTAALFLYVVVVAVALYPLADLLLLHVVLSLRGITTWDYIMANRDTALEPSALSRTVTRALSKIRTPFRSIRVRDSSLFTDSSSTASSRKSLSSVSGPKARVGINPCLACTTDLELIRGRKEAYDYFAAAGPKGDRGQGFDAALLYTPRTDSDSKSTAGLFSQGAVQVYVETPNSSSHAGASAFDTSAAHSAAAAVRVPAAVLLAADSPKGSGRSTPIGSEAPTEALISPQRGAVRFSVPGEHRR